MPTDREYQNALRDLLGGKNDVERGIILDADCAVDRAANGAWVQVWFWIDDDNFEDEDHLERVQEAGRRHLEKNMEAMKELAKR